MTEFGGRLSSLLTNYDITFWLLLASALEQHAPTEIEQRACTAVSFRKVAVRPLNPMLAKTMASLNLVLVESKAADDDQDGDRLKARTARALYSKRFALAHEHLKAIDFPLEALTDLPTAQHSAEHSPNPTLASLSAPTARALGAVFAAIASYHKQPELRDTLHSFGSALGRYLYLWDALEDLASDSKKGSFNAINAACGGYLPEVQTMLRADLAALESGLNSLALGPEGKLCRQLTLTLRRKLETRFSPPVSTRPRHRLAQAGYLQKSSCCDGEVDCCSCGGCDVNCCDCNPCGPERGECCELNCCDLTSCCCFCSDRRSSSSGCCSGLDCGDSGTNHTPTRAPKPAPAPSQKRPSGPGLLEYLGFRRSGGRGRQDDDDHGLDAVRRCPACQIVMLNLTVGSSDIEECRNCGGFWLDDKEIDRIAKIAELPHNLLSRYPTELEAKKFAPGQRSCPVCPDAKLVNVPYLGVPVEMCRACHGFWLEHGALRRVIRAKHSPDRLSQAHQQKWRCPYCETVAQGGSDVCDGCGAPRPKSGFTGKLA